MYFYFNYSKFPPLSKGGYFVALLYLYHMKYLITESQIDNIIFMYLDSQDFIQIERGNIIFFVNSEGDEYAQIKFDKDDGWCGIYYNLIVEISDFFSIQESDSKKVIGRWVENTLQMKVTNTTEKRFLVLW